MASNLVLLPYSYWADPSRSRALSGGQIYIGEVNKDPETFPIDVFYIEEDGTEIPASQPLTIGQGGMIVYNGSVVQIGANENYSMRVRGKHGDQVYNVPNNFATGGATREFVVNYAPSKIEADIHDTLAGAKSRTDLEVGMVIIIEPERAGGRFTAVTGNAPNEYNILDTATTGIQLELSDVDQTAAKWGATNTGDDSDALQAYIDHNEFGTVFLGKKHPVSKKIIAKNVSIVGVPEVTEINAKSATADFGTGSDDCVLSITGGSPILQNYIPTSPVAKGDTDIEFTSAHGLVVGDIFALYDDNDFSYSTYRAQYKAGQYCEVGAVLSTTRLRIKEQFYQSYPTPSNLTIYKCDMHEGVYKNIKTIPPDADPNVIGISVNNLKKSSFDNVGSNNSGNMSMLVYNCYKTNGINMDCQQDRDDPPVGLTSQYGLAITNSLHCRFDGNFSAFRHGGTFSGSSTGLQMTTRYCEMSGAFVSRIVDGGVVTPCCDFHGNTEYCTFEGSTTGAAVVAIAGNYNSVDLHGTSSLLSNGVAVFFWELSGLEHRIVGDYFINGDPESGVTTFDVIDFRTNGGNFNGNIPDNSNQTITLDMKITAPNATQVLARFINDDTDGNGIHGNWNIDASNMVVRSPNVSLVWQLLGNGDKPRFRSPSQTGNGSVSVGGGGTIGSQSIDFQYDFPKPPVVQLTLNQYTTGTDRLGISSSNVTTTNMEPVVFASSGTFTAGDVYYSYTASLWEF